MSNSTQNTKAARKIEQILSVAGTKAAELARQTGVPYQRIEDILLGRTKTISPDLANRIHKVYPGIPIDWLLSDDDRLLRLADDDADKSPAGNDLQEQIALLNERIALLEQMVADKEKIIMLLERKK